jgi:hypothetical protein
MNAGTKDTQHQGVEVVIEHLIPSVTIWVLKMRVSRPWRMKAIPKVGIEPFISARPASA